MKKFKILLNTGYSFEDILEVEVEANSREEALELALAKYPEYSQWNHFII